MQKNLLKKVSIQTMTSDIEKNQRQQIKDLLDKRRKLLSMPAEKALNEILEAKDALPLVHSFAEEDLFFLIHEIGPDDSLPLLSMASAKQWEYILDMDGWEKDRIDPKSTLKWLGLLLKADPDRLVRWLRDEKTAFFEFCLLKSIEVRIREHDEDPSIFGDEFFTLDGVHYIRLLDRPLKDFPDHSPKAEAAEEVMEELLKRLAADDYDMFQRMLHEFSSIIPSETEEEIYRLRNVRLAEKGFLPFDEAVGIYQPLPPKRIAEMQGKRVPSRVLNEINLPVSLYPFSMLGEKNLFAEALQVIDASHILLEIESEFASLCNRIIMADHKVIRERGDLGEIVTKACGYIQIGIQHCFQDKGKPSPEGVASFLSQHPLSDIFRTGYGLVLELKWRAEKFLKKSWFEQNGLTLSFWGEKRLGVLGGLLLKRPLFFDNLSTGKIYREFSSIADVEITEVVLSTTICFDELFSRMALRPVILPDNFLTYRNFLLTLWARKYLGLSREPVPIPMDQFKRFFKMMFVPAPLPEKTGISGAVNGPKRIAMAQKNKFVEWISGETGLTYSEITTRYGSIFEELFDEIENEYGKVSPKDLDPRYVDLFLLERKTT